MFRRYEVESTLGLAAGKYSSSVDTSTFFEPFQEYLWQCRTNLILQWRPDSCSAVLEDAARFLRLWIAVSISNCELQIILPTHGARRQRILRGDHKELLASLWPECTLMKVQGHGLAFSETISIATPNDATATFSKLVERAEDLRAVFRRAGQPHLASEIYAAGSSQLSDPAAQMSIALQMEDRPPLQR